VSQKRAAAKKEMYSLHDTRALYKETAQEPASSEGSYDSYVKDTDFRSIVKSC